MLQVTLGDLRSPWGDLGPSWDDLGRSRGDLGRTWRQRQPEHDTDMPQDGPRYHENEHKAWATPAAPRPGPKTTTRGPKNAPKMHPKKALFNKVLDR